MTGTELKRHIIFALTILIGLFVFTLALYGIIQLIGLSKSNNYNYAFTGSFYNPGPYACYLAVGFPIALRMMLSGGNKLQKWLGTGIVVLTVILVPATMSRTAMLACIAGGAIAIHDYIKTIVSKKSTFHIISLLLLFIAIGCTCYIAKKDSADGRMLMWKVATQAAIDAPLTGVGWDKVAGAYGEAQERYFMSGHGSAQDVLVSDAPDYVFNEYLQVAIAYGPVMSALMIMLVVGGIIAAMRSNTYALAGSATAIAIVMFASYPLQFPLFVVTIAITLCGAWISTRRAVVAYGACAITIFLSILFLTHNNTVDTRRTFMAGHNMHKANDYRKSNAVMLDLLKHTSDPMPLNIIAKNYRALCQPDSAEYYLKKSINRCPNRLYPHYLLMQLYGDSSYYNPIRQCQEAEHILSAPVKIPSQAVEEMREEAKLILKRYK